MVGTKPTDFLSSKAFCRHCLYDATDVRRGMGDGGSEVDIDRCRSRRTTDAWVAERHIHTQKIQKTLKSTMNQLLVVMVQNKVRSCKFLISSRGDY